MVQSIIFGVEAYKEIQRILTDLHSKKFLLVRDASFPFLNIKDYFSTVNIPYATFDEFTPNPLYEDVCKGVALFNREQCDAIVAVGGGSTLDVAKCIKLYARMDPCCNYLRQELFDSKIPLIALPTTAGTGSESTRYAVIYYEGKKQSVTHESIIPNYAILEHSVLKTLPLYQKKCTLLDALCQGIESWWSVNSTQESKQYSKTAIEMILRYKDPYLNENSDDAAEKIMLAANYAGRAINITQTTAAHAMSYKITSMYKLPHGHAVAICLPEVWRFMLTHYDQCADFRGVEYLRSVFSEIALTLGCKTAEEAIEVFEKMLEDMDILNPKAKDRIGEITLLSQSVNPVRMKNTPVIPTVSDVYEIYERIIQ